MATTIRTRNPKKGEVGTYRLTFNVVNDEGGGEGTFWFDLNFDQIYRQDSGRHPAADTEVDVSIFLEDWINDETLYEVLYNLEILNFLPTSLAVEKRS